MMSIGLNFERVQIDTKKMEPTAYVATMPLFGDGPMVPAAPCIWPLAHISKATLTKPRIVKYTIENLAPKTSNTVSFWPLIEP